MKSPKKHHIDLHDTLKEKNDIIFLGSRESGKTSLAHKIAISCADGVSDEIRVPAIIDMRDTPLTFNLKKGILTYYNVIDEGIDTQNIQKCIREKYNEIKFLIILDNFDESNQKHIRAIKQMVLSRKNIRFVALTSAGLSDNNKISKFKSIFSDPKLYSINDFPTKYIRDLSNRKLSFSGEHNPQLVEKIVNQFRENDLPRNGYIVSLLLWSWEQNDKKENINEALLIQSLIDYLLQSADFTQAVRGTFDSRLKSLLLQEISNKIFSSGDYEDSGKLQEFLKKFLEGKGLEFDCIDVLNTLCRSGILKRSNDRVSFKYRCFQEYFNSLYLMQDRDRIIVATNHKNIIPHIREIEFITSLERKSLDIAKNIQKDITKILNDMFPDEDNKPDLLSMNFDSSEINLLNQKTEQLRHINITQDMVDDINDTLEQKSKEHEQKIDTQKKISSLSIRNNSENNKIIPNDSVEIKDDWNDNYDIISANLLLARVIKFSEFDDIENKIENIKHHIKNTILISIFFSNEISKRDWHNDDLMNKIIKNKLNESQEETDNFIRNIKNIAKLAAPLMFISRLKEELSGSSTFIALEKIIADPTTDFETKIIASLFLTCNFKKENLQNLKTLALSTDSTYYKLLIIECMSYSWVTSVIPETIKKEYLDIIAEIERHLTKNFGHQGKLRKGKIIEKLNKDRFPKD